MNWDILEPRLKNKTHIRGISSFQFCDFWVPHFVELCCCQLKALFQAILLGQVVLPTQLHDFLSWDLGDVIRTSGSMHSRPFGGRYYFPSFSISISDSLRVSNRTPLDLMISLGQDLLKWVISGVTCNCIWHLAYPWGCSSVLTVLGNMSSIFRYAFNSWCRWLWWQWGIGCHILSWGKLPFWCSLNICLGRGVMIFPLCLFKMALSLLATQLSP